MQTVIKGKNIDVSESLRQHVDNKCSKLARYLDNILVVEVELSAEKTKSAKTRQVAQVTVDVSGTLLRAEVRADDMFAAVDKVMDKIRRQIKSYKDRAYFRAKTAAGRSRPPKQTAVPEEADTSEEGEISQIGGRIVRAKHFIVKPMSAEEAIDQMELLGHDFFLFAEGATDKISVVYRRRDGTYGLLIPDLA